MPFGLVRPVYTYPSMITSGTLRESAHLKADLVPRGPEDSTLVGLVTSFRVARGAI
jgi:hypothetical protein